MPLLLLLRLALDRALLLPARAVVPKAGCARPTGTASQLGNVERAEPRCCRPGPARERTVQRRYRHAGPGVVRARPAVQRLALGRHPHLLHLLVGSMPLLAELRARPQLTHALPVAALHLAQLRRVLLRLRLLLHAHGVPELRHLPVLRRVLEPLHRCRLHGCRLRSALLRRGRGVRRLRRRIATTLERDGERARDCRVEQLRVERRQVGKSGQLAVEVVEGEQVGRRRVRAAARELWRHCHHTLNSAPCLASLRSAHVLLGMTVCGSE